MHKHIVTLHPRQFSSRGSGFLLTKNGADQPRLSSVVQLCRALLRVENGDKYYPCARKKQSCFETLNIFLRWTFFFLHTHQWKPHIFTPVSIISTGNRKKCSPNHTTQMCERHITCIEVKIYFMYTSEVFSLLRSGFLFMIQSCSEF